MGDVGIVDGLDTSEIVNGKSAHGPGPPQPKALTRMLNVPEYVAVHVGTPLLSIDPAPGSSKSHSYPVAFGTGHTSKSNIFKVWSPQALFW